MSYLKNRILFFIYFCNILNDSNFVLGLIMTSLSIRKTDLKMEKDANVMHVMKLK